MYILADIKEIVENQDSYRNKDDFKKKNQPKNCIF